VLNRIDIPVKDLLIALKANPEVYWYLKS